MPSDIRIVGLKFPAEVVPGADLVQLIVKAAEEQNFFLRGFNYLFIARKSEPRSR